MGVSVIVFFRLKYFLEEPFIFVLNTVKRAQKHFFIFLIDSDLVVALTRRLKPLEKMVKAVQNTVSFKFDIYFSVPTF